MQSRKQSKGDEAGARPRLERRGTKDLPTSMNDNEHGHNDDGRVRNGHQSAIGDVEKQATNISLPKINFTNDQAAQKKFAEQKQNREE